MDYDLLIRGDIVVTAQDTFKADVSVTGGRVVAVGAINAAARETIDAAGLLVFPGGVDTHVHLDQPAPGGEMCDDFRTGTGEQRHRSWSASPAREDPASRCAGLSSCHFWRASARFPRSPSSRR